MGGLYFPYPTPTVIAQAVVTEANFPLLDSTYLAQNVIGGAGANAFGSWLEILADVGVGKKLYGIIVQHDSVMFNTPNYEIEVGEGAVAAEAAVQRVNAASAVASAVGAPSSWAFMFAGGTPLTDNARISLRARDTTAGATSWRVRLLIG